MSNKINRNTIDELIQLRDKEGIDQMTLYERIGKLIGRKISRLRHLSNKEAKIIKLEFEKKFPEIKDKEVDIFEIDPKTQINGNETKFAIADIGVTESILESNGNNTSPESEHLKGGEIPLQMSIADRLERLRKQYNKDKK